MLVPIRRYEVSIPAGKGAALGRVLRPPTLYRHLEDPDLLIGAGHATHLHLLAAARQRGGRTIVLMKPTLPCRWFDLCLVPVHDNPRITDNVLVTLGVLNAVTGGASRAPGTGLILVGGPSRRHGWDEGRLLQQIKEITKMNSQPVWTLANSRRTPENTTEALTRLMTPSVGMVPYGDTEPGWLPSRLRETEQVWVTEDSTSMVYEALTAGAATGILEVPRHRTDRVTRSMDGLVSEGLVTSFAQWRAGHPLRPPPREFNEAERCARWIVQHWLTTP